MARWILRTSIFLFTFTCIVFLFVSSSAAQGAQPAQGGAAKLVAPAVLAKLLPTPEGWTRGEIRSSQIEISAECNYSTACLPLTKGEMRLKVTVADTGSHTDALIALASLVVTLPDDCVQQVPPATTIKKAKVNGLPTAEMWDAAKQSGEISVVVNDRFVVTVEAQKAESLDALRAVLASVDLKAIAALK